MIFTVEVNGDGSEFDVMETFLSTLRLIHYETAACAKLRAKGSVE